MCGLALLRCELLEHLLPGQLLCRVLHFIVAGLLINEDLTDELKLLILEEPSREDVLVAGQQVIEKVSAAS